MALDDQLEIEEPAEAVMNELVGPLSETIQEIGGFIWQKPSRKFGGGLVQGIGMLCHS